MNIKIIEKIKNNFLNNALVKSILGLSIGSIIAKAITLLFTPIISRLYGPEAIGEYSVLISNFRIIEMIAVLGLNTLIIITDDDIEAKGICRLIIKSVLLFSLIFFIIFILIKDIYQLFNININYYISLLLISLLLISDSLYNACNAYSNHFKEYRLIMFSSIICALTSVICYLIFGYFQLGTIGYTLATIISLLLSAIFIIFYKNPFIGKLEKDYSSLKLLRKNIIFPKIQMPANLIGMLDSQIPILIIAKLFSNSLLGIYTMCLKIVTIFIEIIASPINKIFTKEAADRINEHKDIGEFSFSILKKCASISIIPIFILIVAGKYLLPIILGDKWEMAATLISAIAIYALMSILANSLNYHYMIIGKQKLQLCFSIISLIVGIISLYVGFTIFNDFYWTIMFFSISESIVIIIDIGLFLKINNIEIKRYIYFIFFYFFLPTFLTIILEIIR